MPPLPHRILLDLQATQSRAHADRGIARYVKEHVRALRRLGVGDALLLNPHLPFPRALDEDLLTSPDLCWATQPELRRIAEADPRPIAFHLTSPFELSQFAEGELPSHLLRGDVPLIATLYDLIPLIFPEQYLTDPRLSARYRARVEQLHHLDIVLTISEHTRRDALRLVGLDPAKVVTIGFGVSPYFHPAGAGEQPGALLARHLPAVRRPFAATVLGGDPRKNAERLFEAWAEARRLAGVDHQLVVTCSLDPATQARWEDAAASHGLVVGEDVLLTNWQPDPLLRALYQCCELFVYPALYEGAGLPPAEAIACGAPTVTSSTSSLPEVLDWPESTFDPESVDDMAKVIALGLVDDGFRARLRRRASDRSPLLTWDAVARRTVDAMSQLPESGGPTRLPLRIALVGPMPPTLSGIADYNARLLPALASRCELDVFTTSIDRAIDHPNVRWLPTRALREACSPWGYDAVVYTVGNSDDHHDLFNLAEEFPGILWMHDVRLPGLYLTYAAERVPEADRQEYMRYRLLHQYRRRLPIHIRDDVDHTPSDYSALGLGLSKELVDRARGVIVSSKLALRLLDLDQQPDARLAPAWVMPLAAPAPRTDRAPDVPSERPVLVTLGLVSPMKGTDLLLDAFAALRASGVDAELAFVGPIDDGYRAHVHGIVAALGLLDRVTITGQVSDEDYRRWIDRATLAVQLRVATNGESSAAVTDALAGGLPVMTNVHAAAELPEGTVVMVPWNVDVADLAGRMRDLLDDPAGRDTLRRRGWDFARSWGPEQVADELLRIVGELAPRPR